IGLISYVLDLADQSVLTNDDLAGDGPLAQLHEAGVHRVVQRNRGIVFRLDRTDRNAIRVAGAGPAIPIWLGVARGRHAPDRNVGDCRPPSPKSRLRLGERTLVQRLVDLPVRP